MTLYNVRITRGIIQEVFAGELWTRSEDPSESSGMAVYQLIRDTRSTRKDGSITIVVTPEELDELHEEARYLSDSSQADDPSAGYIKSWAALRWQIAKIKFT